MRKVVFLGLPAVGHTNPTVGVVKELVGRGVKVIYYNTEMFRERLEKAGAEFRPYRSKGIFNFTSEGMAGRNLNRIFIEMMPGALEIVDAHLAEIKAEEADCLVYDSAAFWSPSFIEALNIPAICCTTTFALDESTRADLFNAANFKQKVHMLYFLFLTSLLSSEEKAQVRRLNGGKSGKFMELFSNTTESATESFVFTSTAMQPKVENFKTTHHFVGPSISERHEEFKLPEDSRPLVYISIGTVMSSHKFFKNAFRAFGDGKYRVLLSIGQGASLEELGPIPANFIVKNYFPQLEVLKRASLFVSHCGMNSVHESLYHGVPIIGLPQTVEQALVATRVEKQGAGIYLRSMSVKKMQGAAEKILTDNNYRDNCLRLKRSFIEAGGPAKAAEVIINCSSKHGRKKQLLLH